MTVIDEFSSTSSSDIQPFKYDVVNLDNTCACYQIEIEEVKGVDKYYVLLYDFETCDIIHFEKYMADDNAIFSFITYEILNNISVVVRPNVYPNGYKDEMMTIGAVRVKVEHDYNNVIDVALGVKTNIKNAKMLPARICPVWDNRKGIATIISDDGHYESGMILNGLAKENDLQVTVAGSVKYIAPYLKEWKKIEEEGYVEIVNHTYNHIPINPKQERAKDEIIHEYKDAMFYLKNNFKTPQFTFVYPFNNTTEIGMEVLDEMGILAARRGARGDNYLLIPRGHVMGEMLNLKMHGIGDLEDAESRKSWIDNAIHNHRWHVEMWHDVSPKGDVGYQPISIKDAQKHMQYMAEQVKNGNLWVATFTKAVSYIYQRIYSRIYACVKEDEIYIILLRDNIELPWDDFNISLTIAIRLPNEWSAVRDKKGVVYAKDENGQIYFDIKYPVSLVVMERCSRTMFFD